MLNGINKSAREMAKKGQATKKTKTEIEGSPIVQPTDCKEGLNDTSISLTSVMANEEDITVCTIQTIKHKPIETMNIEELMWLEKACALICRKYETTARIDFVNNHKLTEFSNYYKEILKQLEKCITNACKDL